MPGFRPSVGDELELRVVCSSTNQLGENVTHWVVLDAFGLGGPSLEDIVAQFDNDIGASYQAFMPSLAAYRGCKLCNLSGLRTNYYTATDNAGAGTGGVKLAPTQCSALISLQTSFAGPRYRGRMYPPFPASELIEANGTFSGAGNVAIEQIRNKYKLEYEMDFGDRGCNLGLVIKHQKDKQGNPPPSPYTFVTKTIASDLVATQKRRGAFGKPNSVII